MVTVVVCRELVVTGIRGMVERARMHQGEVQVVGKAGSGTRVSIAFRITQDGRAEAASRVAESSE